MNKGSRDPDDPWDWMIAEDTARFGEIIFDREEQKRWSCAVFLGGLPYMWRKATVCRDMIYEKLELAPGDRVLIIGEALDACGFSDDVRERIGPDGELVTVEIMDEARDAYMSGVRGRGGQLATWRFDYTRDYANEHFDCAAVIQGVQHTDDWRETAAELVRITKPGRRIVLAEIAFGPPFLMKAGQDIHLEYLITKLFKRIGWHPEDFPYYSPAQLTEAFSGLVQDPETFTWKGIEMFWGRKP